MATIQGVYVALFGRPADPTGLNYFNGVTKNGADLSAIGNLASTSEYQARFSGQSNVQIINSIYQSLFGRDADVTGINFFTDALNKGTLTINNIAIAILDGAQGTDKTIVTNKVAAADLYTKALDTGSEIVAYTGLSAAAQGRAFISGVSSTVPTSAQVDTAVAAMVTASQGGGTGTTGVTLNLTTATDIFGPSAGDTKFKTTDGNDTIRAFGNLASTNIVDGGNGTDTLTATLADSATIVKPVLKSVENVDAVVAGNAIAVASGIDLGDSTGVQKVSVSDAVIANTKAFSFNGLAAGTVAAVSNVSAAAGDTGTVNVNLKDASGANDSVTINLSKVGTAATGTVLLKAAGVENVTLNSLGTVAADTNKVTFDATGAKAVVVTGDHDLTATIGTSLSSLKSVDASALAGKLALTLSNGVAADTVAITGTAKADTFTVGTEADTFVYKAANASTLNAQDTITGFDFGTSTTSVDKFDLKAFGLASTSTYAAASFKAAGDNAGFFSTLGATVKMAGFYDAGDNATYVYVDANNNGSFESATDLAIKVTGNQLANIDKGDFILA